MSDRDITITDAKVLDVPEGIKVLGYGAYNLEDTQGLPLLAVEGYSYTPQFRKFKDYSEGGFTVKAKTVSDVFYTAHLRVTGKIQKNVKQCRFAYRQGEAAYSQTLKCGLELRLKK